MINIILNGESKEIKDALSLEQLIIDFGHSVETCVAEVNEDIISRDQCGSVIIKEGDKVELIKFVGGG